MVKNDLHIGCAGWNYLNVKRYFENSVKFKSKLEAYSKLFDFVELNATFYRLPRKSTVKRWRETVGEDFIFSVKAPGKITHELRFEKNSIEVLKEFLDVIEPLKANVVLFQSPASFKPSDENIKKAVEFFKEAISICKERGIDKLAWEVRWKDTWTKEVVFSAFSKIKDIVQCVDPLRQDWFYGDRFAYFRLHGFGKRIYDYIFKDSELEFLKDFVLKQLEKGKEVYVVFNNYNMYEDALKFKRMMGV